MPRNPIPRGKGGRTHQKPGRPGRHHGGSGQHQGKRPVGKRRAHGDGYKLS